MQMLGLIAQLSLFHAVFALRFTLEAGPAPGNTRCIRDFVTKDTMVVVRTKTNGYQGDGQTLSTVIFDSKGNQYGYRENFVDEYKQVFTPSQDAVFDVCYTNKIVDSRQTAHLTRDIELEVEIGASARDWNAVQAAEKLKPAEVDLRRVVETMDEIQKEMQYLISREERLRDTNESTNRRVRSYSILILLGFLGLGAWQIHYLRSYFRAKHII